VTGSEDFSEVFLENFREISCIITEKIV